MTKQIELSQNKVALVDDSDFDAVNQYKWCALRVTKWWYAARGNNGTTEYLHRFIMQPGDGMTVDHINNDGLDCRRVNMRECTVKQNGRNKQRHFDNTTGFKGVTFEKGRWRASIWVNGKRISLGYYLDKHDAAGAYDNGARKYFGEFAKTNFK